MKMKMYDKNTVLKLNIFMGKSQERKEKRYVNNGATNTEIWYFFSSLIKGTIELLIQKYGTSSLH
jgi:hypothetical protein